MNSDHSAVTGPPPLDRKSLVLGLLGGAILAGLVGALSALLLARRAPAPPEAAFTVEKQSVRLKPGAAQPMGFATAEVEEGPPLPRPADVARVLAVESRSAASFAPLEGRVERVS